MNKGLISPTEIANWSQSWHKRIHPEILTILGGEPTLNPQLPEIIDVSRTYWPDSFIRVVTNGLLLLNASLELPKALARCKRHTLYISVHHGSDEYHKRLAPVRKLLSEWKTKFGINVEDYNSYTYWSRRYKTENHQISPFDDGNPRASWSACPSKDFPQLFDGKLWKCASLAYLHKIPTSFLSPDWHQYLTYNGLSSSCTDKELLDFLSLEEESFCGMCPSSTIYFSPGLPFRKKVEKDVYFPVHDDIMFKR
jgi:hypothetical protein